MVLSNRLVQSSQKQVSFSTHFIWEVIWRDVPDQQAYELTGNVFSIYGFQYKPGFEDAVSSHKWTSFCTQKLNVSIAVHFLDRRRQGCLDYEASWYGRWYSSGDRTSSSTSGAFGLYIPLVYIDTNPNLAVVHHCQSWHVEELRFRRLGTFGLPDYNESGLDSCLPGPWQHQHWMWSSGLPYCCVHWPVRWFMNRSLFSYRWIPFLDTSMLILTPTWPLGGTTLASRSLRTHSLDNAKHWSNSEWRSHP